MARPKKPVAEDEERSQLDPAIEERKRLKSFAMSRNLLSNAPSKPISPLTPSNLILKHQGRDIVKKGQRKNRFLFSFPGLLAPVSAGKIGELKDLGTKNPVLYIDFPQVRCRNLWFYLCWLLFFLFGDLGFCFGVWIWIGGLSGSDEAVWYYCWSEEQVPDFAVCQRGEERDVRGLFREHGENHHHHQSSFSYSFLLIFDSVLLNFKYGEVGYRV